MKPRLLSSRPAVTRTSRHDPRGVALESVAAEFALLAQRRSRLARQLDLLGRQLAAASTSMDAVQGRMAQLAQRIDGIDPDLRPLNPAPPPAPAPEPVRSIPRPPGLARAYQLAQQKQADLRPQQVLVPRNLRPMSRRRPFLPE